jgi:hypothetical protein
VTTVWLFARTFSYPAGGGSFWVYLNWALGLAACGCRVVWLESVPSVYDTPTIHGKLHWLRQRLEPYGLHDVALCRRNGEVVPDEDQFDTVALARAAEADLLLDLNYNPAPALQQRFRCSALIDIDPGLTQLWVARGELQLLRYDYYFTIGETVGRPGARFPDCGISWIYTPPCVALEFWPVTAAPSDAAFRTVSHWQGREWVTQGDHGYSNNKRDGFLPFVSLPERSEIRLELALSLGREDMRERAMLTRLGWHVVDSEAVAYTPEAYRSYIQGSRGEFSCAKPSCVRFQNAWISDRTACYLASGKPAVVQHTGPSAFLPDAEGLLRFRDIDEAVARLRDVQKDYERHSRAARALAEKHFDAKKVAGNVLGHIFGSSADRRVRRWAGA